MKIAVAGIGMAQENGDSEMTPVEVGDVEAIFRYPVKSMRGEQLESAQIGWHGLEGDRRFALRRLDYKGGGFPWLTAGKLPELLLYTPHQQNDPARNDGPTHVRTPGGAELPIFGEELAAEIGGRLEAPVEMMHLKHGIFDEGSVSVIASATVRQVGQLAGVQIDARHFRPNILVRSLCPTPFQEDDWVGGLLTFGEGDGTPAIAVTVRDVRCAMLNLDPDSASPCPEIMKTVVRANQNHAGIYGSTARAGRIFVGQRVYFYPIR